MIISPLFDPHRDLRQVGHGDWLEPCSRHTKAGGGGTLIRAIVTACQRCALFPRLLVVAEI